MCKFIPISYWCKLTPYVPLHYIAKLQSCFNKYSKFLLDDYSDFSHDVISYVRQSPFFWLILSYDNQFMGFVLLDNFVGDEFNNYSAELVTCFEKHAWGSFTKYSAKIFLKKAFDEFGLYKIKANIFPDNFRISKLLKSAGFQYETTLKNETMRNNKLQDIDVYALYRTYYYKNEVKDENKR